jgi:SAM-dependent methyltransferase
MLNTTTSVSEGRRLRDHNRRYYDSLWLDASLVEPQRFNTWPLVQALVAQSTRRLEVAPGLRPRLPIEGTHFVDISAPALATLSSRGGTAVQSEISSLPFRDRSFDLVCALDIIEHVKDHTRALSELCRVTTDDGVLLLSVPLYESRWTSFDEFVGHCRRYDPEDLNSLLIGQGLAVHESAVFGMQPKSSQLLDLGMWWMQRDRERAMWWYNKVFMPLGMRFQKRLQLQPGMIATQGVDEILLICRKTS